MASDDVVTDDELVAIHAALLMMMDNPEGREAPAVRVREAWPSPSPWRWANR